MIHLVDIRKYLIENAQKKQMVTYKEFRDYLGLEYAIQVFNPLKQISKDCISKGEPLLSALVVNEDGLPGKGFFDEKTRIYLGYDGPAAGPEAQEVQQRELNKIFKWKW